MRHPQKRLGTVSVRPFLLGALALVGLPALTGALMLAGVLPGPGATSRAAAQPASIEPTPQTDDSLPAQGVTMLGSSPLEAPGETWGVGTDASSTVLVRYTTEGGWSLGPDLLDAAGQPLSGFKLDRPEGLSAPSPLAGQVTNNGSGVLVGSAPASSQPGVRQIVLVRNPGGSFQETAPVLAEGEAALLKEGESLFGAKRAPLIAPLDEAGGKAGALVVPVTETGSVEGGVLYWNGSRWTREPIEIPTKSSGEFFVLAIGASSPSNAWLLAQLSSAYSPGAVALFRRHLGEGGKVATWRPVALIPGSGDKEAHPLTLDEKPFTVRGTGAPPRVKAQVLTVTGEGVWIDGERADVQASATMLFKPEGEGGGRVLAGWCKIPAGAPAGTPPCDHELPEVLPTGPSRSIAWANPTTPEGVGERVITGLPNGISLRLEGTSFRRVLALGGEVGASYGAAFSNPREGWLGQQALPVHLTSNPVASRLKSWPVSFRHTLLAIAPQPGAPVGSLSSEALAVGDQGEVARYEPGKGWMPESLLGAGGRFETPRLRAVAWPTPTRAYAVGDLGQMWLWRGETGLWESDPAIPFNFRGNLLGVAFDPNNPARGYAVGSGGVLLRYGKTWTQEALPPQAEGASFTSIAFAGSEAIVAYRKLVNPASNTYVGGLLVNDGSGWRIDQGAAAVMGSNVPWAVAGLPDGGAAFTAAGVGEGSQVYERQGPGAPWQPPPTPFPGGEPGSLALFREGGALRAIASGSAGGVEIIPPSPPGFPQPLVPPFGLGSNPEAGVLRQTSGGWSDEEHELNNAKEPPGKYRVYDTVYQPDPVSAVLIDPSGAQGWAVGGFVDTENKGGVLDTADVERYPADGIVPPGIGSSPVTVKPNLATFAIGGGSQCAAPCADRELAGIGPDVWLSAALAKAGGIAGVRAFLYTGPRVTTGETSGAATLAIPYTRELSRYSEILGSSPIPAYAASSPTDLDGEGSECTFKHVFEGFPPPFGTAAAPVELAASRSSEPCSSGSQPAYYAWDSNGSGGKVRVIVLDDGKDIDQTQLEWLVGQLAHAKALPEPEPAIVIGNANLNAQIAGGDNAAMQVAHALISGGASAYFYDSPEENVQKPLLGSEVLTFGSGTLGYVNFTAESSGAFLGASGFLLAQVNVAKRKSNNVAPVEARLIPDIGELALEAKDGTLLRRSQPALFDALARRPRAGNRSPGGGEVRFDTDPYIPIPSNCVGAACANGIFPEYEFSSSRTDIGDFVQPNLASPDPHAVLLGANEKPIHDALSGLFCAYNAGTTIVTISAGGLSSSLPVTVQAGSVRRPCGTQPLKELPSQQQSVPVPPPAPAPAPAPAGPAPASAPPPLPVPPPPALIGPTPARQASRPPPPPFFLPPALAAPVLAFVPPPVPTPARPTPPSGTSAVTSPIEVAEHEEEEEEATESVSNQALAYRAPEHEPSPAYILGIVLLAAFAGASVHRRPRRGRHELRIAPATLSTQRAQRRMGAGRGRRP